MPTFCSSRGTCAAVAVAMAFSAGAARPTMADETTGHGSNHSTILGPEDLGGMDLDQLSRVQIVSATLTPTQTRLVPAKTTVLDQATIAQSGARYLNELFEIYAPNTQLFAHNSHHDELNVRLHQLRTLRGRSACALSSRSFTRWLPK